MKKIIHCTFSLFVILICFVFLVSCDNFTKVSPTQDSNPVGDKDENPKGEALTKKYSITYVSEHGTIPAKVNEAITLPNSLPFLSEFGWKFEGWYINRNYDESSRAVAGTSLIADITLYAKWTKEEKPKETYTITYVINGHGEQPDNLFEQKKLPDPLPTLFEEEWTFNGWFSTSTFEIESEVIAGTELLGDIILYAQWTKKPTEELDKTFYEENYIIELIKFDLSREYDVFDAYIIIEDIKIYGICYVDYREGYTDENEVYFSAGFIAYPKKNFSSENLIFGLEIYSLNKEDEKYSFIFAYSSDDIKKHCIVNDNYVKYDIENNQLIIEKSPYHCGMQIENYRGNIYNYDTKEFVYIVEMLDYIPITGESLIGEEDYTLISNEINRIIYDQEANLSYADIETYISFSLEALSSYLLGLQEETFMGISTKELISYARNLKPLEHLQISLDENGNTTIKIIEITKLPTVWEKILTSIVCSCTILCGVGFKIVGKLILPGLDVLGGALIGAGFEALSQVVIENIPVSDIQWSKISVAAFTGALSSFIGIKLDNVQNVFFKNITNTICNSIIDGGENFVDSLFEGKNFLTACESLGYGVAIGIIVHGTMNVAVTVQTGNKLINKTSVNFSINEGRNLRKLSSEMVTEGLNEIQKIMIEKNLTYLVEEVLVADSYNLKSKCFA